MRIDVYAPWAPNVGRHGFRLGQPPEEARPEEASGKGEEHGAQEGGEWMLTEVGWKVATLTR